MAHLGSQGYILAAAIYTFIDPKEFAYYSGLDVEAIEKFEQDGVVSVNKWLEVLGSFETEAILAMVYVFTAGVSIDLYLLFWLILGLAPGIAQAILTLLSFLFQNIQW